MAALSERQIAAVLLIGSSFVFLVAGYLFTARVIWMRPAAQSPLHLRWERGLVIAAFLISLFGFTLLDGLLREAGDRGVARLGWTLYLISAAVVVVAETTYLTGGDLPYPQIVAHVVLAFLAQAAFGAALLQTGITPSWVGWAALIWNVGLLIVMPLAFPRDIYYPWLFYVAPLLIGIVLLRR